MRLVEFVNLNPYQADKICVSLITFQYHRLHEDIAAAHKKIEFAQMNLLGFILNNIKTKHHGKYYSKYGSKHYYKKGYGYGYGYYGNKPETEDAATESDT